MSLVKINLIMILNLFILYSISAETTGPKNVVPLYTTNDVVFWPSTGDANKTGQKNLFDEAVNLLVFQNNSYSVPIGKRHTLNADRYYLYGSLELENIDISIELTDKILKTKDWYRQLKKWGNNSSKLTEDEISMAMTSAFAERVRLNSITVDSAKASGTGFESMGFLKKLAYAQRWMGQFGGNFTDPFREARIELYPQSNQPILKFTKVTRVELVGESVRIVAEKALLTIDVSKINLPLVYSTMTKGSLTLQGFKSGEISLNTTSSVPSQVLSLTTGSGIYYWPSVGSFDKQVSGPRNDLENNILSKKYSNMTTTITTNTPYDMENSDFYVYGTVLLEKIDIHVYPEQYGFLSSLWYRPILKWGTIPTRPITDQEISEAMDSAFAGTVKLAKISSESVSAIGGGFESLGYIKRFGMFQQSAGYALKWKGSFSGSITNSALIRSSAGFLKLKAIDKQTILNFSNVTKVELLDKNRGIRVVADKAILSVDVSEVDLGMGIAIVKTGSLKLEGVSSHSNSIFDSMIVWIVIIITIIVFVMVMLGVCVRVVLNGIKRVNR
ncbi:hypothetical protein HDV02_000533 [Globomyces sp. JEL0801]|nr:hypothetical protein HDV02_000533 [Globomyces sp. JEL0801]